MNLGLLVAFVMSGISATGDGSSEARFDARNMDAFERHQTAMYVLADELSACAGFYSLARDDNPAGVALASMSENSETMQSHFIALGADALESVMDMPRNELLKEMEARLVTSRRDLLNRFGSLGGTIETEQSRMHEECMKLRKSRRGFFGWSRP